MSTRVKMISDFYAKSDEDKRLERSRRGQLEYYTTMEYIHRYADSGAKILEVGAGTGRYSVALAKEGFDVTSVELVESNLEQLRKNSAGIANIRAFQGDATNLSDFAEESFDMTLVLGPMYHLYDKGDINRAIDEAVRVTKKDGIILFAFISVFGIMFANYLNERWADGEEENFTKEYKIRHFEEQMFTGYDIPEFESLFEQKPVSHIATVNTDGILEVAEDRPDFYLSDTDFDAFKKWHLAFAEKRELLGTASHLLYICKSCNR